MPITRDPDFPAEIADLVQGFNRLSEGHQTLHVVEAATNFLIAAINNHSRTAGLGRAKASEIALYIGGNLSLLVTRQWDRQRQDTDIDVPMGGN